MIGLTTVWRCRKELGRIADAAMQNPDPDPMPMFACADELGSISSSAELANKVLEVVTEACRSEKITTAWDKGRGHIVISRIKCKGGKLWKYARQSRHQATLFIYFPWWITLVLSFLAAIAFVLAGIGNAQNHPFDWTLERVGLKLDEPLPDLVDPHLVTGIAFPQHFDLQGHPGAFVSIDIVPGNRESHAYEYALEAGDNQILLRPTGTWPPGSRLRVLRNQGQDATTAEASSGYSTYELTGTTALTLSFQAGKTRRLLAGSFNPPLRASWLSARQSRGDLALPDGSCRGAELEMTGSLFITDLEADKDQLSLRGTADHWAGGRKDGAYPCASSSRSTWPGLVSGGLLLAMAALSRVVRRVLRKEGNASHG
jgi:hypothetical protein